MNSTRTSGSSSARSLKLIRLTFCWILLTGLCHSGSDALAQKRSKTPSFYTKIISAVEEGAELEPRDINDRGDVLLYWFKSTELDGSTQWEERNLIYSRGRFKAVCKDGEAARQLSKRRDVLCDYNDVESKRFRFNPPAASDLGFDRFRVPNINDRGDAIIKYIRNSNPGTGEPSYAETYLWSGSKQELIKFDSPEGYDSPSVKALNNRQNFILHAGTRTPEGSWAYDHFVYDLRKGRYKKIDTGSTNGIQIIDFNDRNQVLVIDGIFNPKKRKKNRFKNFKLPEGWDWIYPLYLNNRGTVVGSAGAAGKDFLFLRDRSGKFYNLRDLLKKSPEDSGIHGFDASWIWGLNNRDEIVLMSSHYDEPPYHTVLLSPRRIR